MEELERRINDLEYSNNLIRNLTNKGFVKSDLILESLRGVSLTTRVVESIVKANNKEYIMTVSDIFDVIKPVGSNYFETKSRSPGNGVGVVLYTTGSLPSGLNQSFYYVRDSSNNRFRLADFQGGPVVSFSGNGTGVHYYVQ